LELVASAFPLRWKSFDPMVGAYGDCLLFHSETRAKPTPSMATRPSACAAVMATRAGLPGVATSFGQRAAASAPAARSVVSS
jgi:hypothetical protein